MFLLTHGSQSRHQGRQGLRDVTVVHVRLIDLQLLSCEGKKNKRLITAPQDVNQSIRPVNGRYVQNCLQQETQIPGNERARCFSTDSTH